MSNYNFKQKELVAFSYGGCEGYGEVVGVATLPMAVLGCFYMIRVLTSATKLPTAEYPFTTISMPEIGMIKLSLDNELIEIDDVPTFAVKLGEKVVCYLKCEYLTAVQFMPEPERTNHVAQWASDLFNSGSLPSKITYPHLHQFMRHIVGCK